MTDRDICANCGGTKPTDRYRACPECRAVWRSRSRKPGGPAEMREAMDDLLVACDGIHAAFGAPGNWGYGTREGDALFALYKAAARLPRRQQGGGP